MTVIVEKLRGAHFVISEANFHRSRDNVTIVAGSGKIDAGTVLGRITTGGKFKPATDTGSDGAQVAAAILLEAVDATATDVAGAVISREAEVFASGLTYDASVSDAGKVSSKIAQLAVLGIIARV
jgi:hypothetical protein